MPSLIPSETLQVLGHDNIFAVGDVVDLPIQRSLTASQHQIRCVTQNALSYLKAESMTGHYKMESGLPLYTGIAKMNTFWSKEGKDSIGLENIVKDTLMYYAKCKYGAKGQTKMYTGKSSGVSKLYTLQNKFDKPVSTGAEPRFVIEH